MTRAIVKSLLCMLVGLTTYIQAADANGASCLALVSSASSCSAESSAFYATVTDVSAAEATAAACLCKKGPATFDAQVSACESYASTASAALASAVGTSVNVDELQQYLGFCGGAPKTAGSSTHSVGSTASAAVITSKTNATQPAPAVFTGAGNSNAGSVAAAAAVGVLAMVL